MSYYREKPRRREHRASKGRETVSSKKALIIINPVSGKATAKTKLFDIVSEVEAAGYEAAIHITTGKGDARETARASAPDKGLLVCCGGDGTLNEVISGVADIDRELRPEISYIPVGTTNDFASTAEIPKSVDGAIKLISHGSPCEIDIGRFNDSYFNYVAACGIFTRTSYATNQNLKNTFGHLAYIIEGMKELTDFSKTYNVNVEYDGNELSGDFMYISVTNSTSIGGIFKLPQSKVNICDGTFEIMLIRSPRNAIEVQQILQMLRDRKYDGSKIIFLQAKSIRLRLDQPTDWTVDGEYVGKEQDVTIENLHKAITMRL